MPRTILVEGLPGIGKSTLLKQMSFLWASGSLFKKMKFLFLLPLRNPGVRSIETINDFVRYFYDRDEDIPSCCTQILQDNGRSVIIFLDGYDEYPVELRRNSFISSIIARKVLPNSAIVISSRPHGSTNLRSNVLFRIEILGFSEDDRMHFIEQTLVRETQKIEELKSYLEKHPTINSLCFIPFNMTILLFVYKLKRCLPSSFIELCNLFINLTICEHLARSGKEPQECHQNLSGLPQPYNNIIKQLSEFAFKKLEQDRLVFSYDEIKEFCSDIDRFPNCLGLLQAVEHVGLFGKIRTFNFIHLSIQEYLAACFVSNLQDSEDELFSVLMKYFWVGNLHNVFNIYIAMTKGQHPAFKRFLCDGNSSCNPINTKFLGDTWKCLRLYRCFLEVNDKEMLSTIEQTFSDAVLGLQDAKSPIIEDVVTVLTHSKIKYWKKVWFRNCHILDNGIKLLHQSLQSSEITISQLSLVNSDLTSLSDYYLSHIILTCKVKGVYIKDNLVRNEQIKAIGESEQFISSILSPPTVIKELVIKNNHYSSIGWAECLFKLLKENTSLKWLLVQQNNFIDKVWRLIIPALQVNKTLKGLTIYDNSISGEAAISIVHTVMKYNTKLEKLRFPQCFDSIKEGILDKIRKNEGRDVTLSVTFQ